MRRLGALYDEYAIITSRLVESAPDTASYSTYYKSFGPLPRAFQELFVDARRQARECVVREISSLARLIEEYEDFLVINQSFTVLIQPSVPVPCGYDSYWEFYPDRRPSVDVTLGVPLAGENGHGILGYLALPRLMVFQNCVRLPCGSAPWVELFGHSGLEFIKELLS